MGKDESIELLKAIEGALVQHQAFGDSTYILEQLEVAFVRRLDVVAAHLPTARKLLSAYRSAEKSTRDQFAGNTVIRCSVQHAHRFLDTGTPYGLSLAQCEEAFETASRHLQLGQSGTPLENGGFELQRLGQQSYHGWIWSEDYPNNVFGRSFRTILEQEYGESLCTINDEELAQLQRGEQLLQDCLPFLARSALGHAHLVGCFSDVGFWKGKLSSSQIRMGGTIFLNRQMLKSPWSVAEHLLHESLHQKFYDFRHGHSLLDPEFSDEDPPRVCSLWNAEELNRANCWDTHRAFAAFHVYVQLALLATMAEKRVEVLEQRYGQPGGMIESRKALDRSRFLGEQLREKCAKELGVAGGRMLDWLMSVLDFLDPSPPPKGAYVHLLLDRYEREANRVDSVFKQSDAARAGLSRHLVEAVEAEVTDAHRVLAAVGATTQQRQLDAALGRYADGELAPQFPAVRRLIVKAIHDASPDGYGLASRAQNGADPELLVRELVDAGSNRLYLIQANVPAAVAGAKRRAKDLRFSKSCEDAVGRLLAVLAAAVPPGGRVLEIGTGVGVGMAWITSGLGNRTDVEVLSIEGDRRLSNAAMAWAWPPYVKILTADATEELAMVGTFNFVFADAAPIKYGQIGSVLQALRPGGMLVIDDLHAGPETTEQQHAEKDALRQSLRAHPGLQLVELDWASGLILAALSACPG